MSSVAKPVLSVQPHNHAIVASVLCSHLDHENTLQLQRDLEAAVAASPASSVVLDLARVEFLPSMALNLLVKTHKQFVQAERKFVLAGVQPNVRELLQVTALDRYLGIYPTTEEGLKRVGA